MGAHRVYEIAVRVRYAAFSKCSQSLDFAERVLAGYETFTEWLERLLRPIRDSRSAVTIEAFGWLQLAEGVAIFIAPRGVAELLQLPDFAASAAVYFRLVGLLIAGLGVLYTVSGRLNAQGFVFASFLDRPVVPFIMFALWHWGLVPGILAVAFSLQDFGSFLWTVWAWRRERRMP
jgi:hypothetical protein